MDILHEAACITGREFEVFLEEKGIERGCRECNSGTAIPIEGDDQLLKPLFFCSSERAEMGDVFPVISLVCPNCGHTRNFMAGAIIEWRG